MSTGDGPVDCNNGVHMPEYSAVACLEVPVGWRVIVVSDLFLDRDADGRLRRCLAGARQCP